MLVFCVAKPCGSRYCRCQRLEERTEAVYSSYTLVSSYKSAWRYYPEDQHVYLMGQERPHFTKQLLPLKYIYILF